MPTEPVGDLADLLERQAGLNQDVIEVFRLIHAELSRQDVLIAGLYDQLAALSNRIESVTQLVSHRSGRPS